MSDEEIPRIRILVMTEPEAPCDGWTPDVLLQAFKEDVEGPGAAFAVERARLSDPDDFTPAGDALELARQFGWEELPPGPRDEG